MQSNRWCLALVAALVCAPAVAVPPAAGQPGQAPVAARAVVAEGSDFASDVYGDPWDMANPADVHTWFPAVQGGAAAIADGRLRYDLTGPSGHVWFVFPGFEGALPAGRDGNAVPLDVSRYRTAVIRVRSSGVVNTSFVARACTGVSVSCDEGGTNVQLTPGWGTYVVPLPGGAPLHGLYLAVGPGPAVLEIDWVRLVAGPVDPVPVVAVGPVFWDADDDAGNNTADQPGWGRVPAQGFPAAGYPPGDYRFYSALGDGSAEDLTRGPLSSPLTVLARPRTVVLDPDAGGGDDYVTASTGDAWDFEEASDGVVHNAADVGLAGGVLSATNTSNDPFVQLRMGPVPIDPARYHRLTVSFANDGPFDLSFDPGGGTHGRFLWAVEDPRFGRYANGNDMVVYPHHPTHVVDLAAAGALAVEEGEAHRWGQSPVLAVRFDPNEDPGPRRWHLDEVRLAADDETRGGGFDVTFEDAGAQTTTPPGTTTRYEVRADTDRVGHDGVLVASGAVTGARTVARWDTAGATPGTYHVHVRVIRAVDGVEAVSDTYATGPLVVRPEDAGGTPAPPGPAPAPPPAPAPDLGPDVAAALRLAGPSRVDTAAAVAREAFPDGAATAVVVTGGAFADALSAAPLAAALRAPVLLTSRDALPDATAAVLEDLDVDDVVVLGGTAAVGDGVVAALDAEGYDVQRIAGPDRFATAAAVGEEMRRRGAVADEVVLASGATFPDALAGGWRAAVLGTPLLLLGDDGPTAATAELLADLGVRRATVVGGTAVVSEAAAGAVRDLGLEVRRLAGDSRWATAAAVVRDTPTGPPAGVLVASGEDFPDALAAGPAAAATGRLLALTARDVLPEPTAQLLREVAGVDVRVVGGPAAVSSLALAAIAGALGVPLPT